MTGKPPHTWRLNDRFRMTHLSKEKLKLLSKPNKNINCGNAPLCRRGVGGVDNGGGHVRERGCTGDLLTSTRFRRDPHTALKKCLNRKQLKCSRRAKESKPSSEKNTVHETYVLSKNGEGKRGLATQERRFGPRIGTNARACFSAPRQAPRDAGSKELRSHRRCPVTCRVTVGL